MPTYNEVVHEFNIRNCKLLTSEEDFLIVNNINRSFNFKLYYIASCGHNHTVFYNVFKYRSTGIVCRSCKNKINQIKMKDQFETNKIPKLNNIQQECNYINKIINLLQEKFNIIKAFDGCLVDIIFKPKNIIENNWVGIQVKTTFTRKLTYSFCLNNNYKNCLMLLYCCDDNATWLIPENNINNITKISIGYKKSKYNIYKIDENLLSDKLNELYLITSKFNFDILDKPINIYQQREQEFRKYRERIIDFIQFDYPFMEGTNYDFKINNYNIQEKVTQLGNDNRYNFQLIKNNGIINNKRNQIQYDIGDNDFYWLNCANESFFFVIPEQVLIDKEIIGNKNKKLLLKLVVKEQLHKNSEWLQPYLFQYDKLDKDRLFNIFYK
jgi:hypothetical protein